MPLQDNRRINGPTETYQIASFLPPQTHKDTKRDILDEKGLRQDERRADEIRPVYLKAGVVQKANGSAYLETSGTKLTCAVYGPRDYIKRHEFRSSGKLSCNLSFAPFSRKQRFTDIRDTLSAEYSNFIADALISAVSLDAYPKSQIDVYINVLEDNGNTLSYAIMAAAVALADAGIEMVDLVTSTSLVFNDKLSCLDPDANEETNSDMNGHMTVAYLPSLNKISCMLQNGELDVEQSIRFVNTCLEGCLRVHAVMKDCLQRAAASQPEEGN